MAVKRINRDSIVKGSSNTDVLRDFVAEIAVMCRFALVSGSAIENFMQKTPKTRRRLRHPHTSEFHGIIAYAEAPLMVCFTFLKIYA